jgi:hypothetical protein
MRRPVALSLLLCAACAAESNQVTTFLDFQTVVPPSLQAHPATSQMRLAEYNVPRADGTHAEVVVYYFGQGQGGSADANIARWTSQFTSADGGAVTPKVMTVDGTAFRTTVAELEGTYARGIGMGPGAAEAAPNQGLVAAVVETPEGNLFLQLFGDRGAVTATREDFLGMVRAIRPAHSG